MPDIYTFTVSIAYAPYVSMRGMRGTRYPATLYAGYEFMHPTLLCGVRGMRGTWLCVVRGDPIDFVRILPTVSTENGGQKSVAHPTGLYSIKHKAYRENVF